jgi:hypothetical protein
MPKPEQNIGELPSAFRFRPHPATDFIDMEFVIQEIDQALRAQVIAVTFETVAAMHRTLADGATKIAGIIAGGKRG